MKKIIANKKYLILIGVLIITLTASITFFIKKPKQQLTSETEFPILNENADNTQLTELPAKDLKQLTFLILGYGGAGHQGGFLTDVIQIVNIDFKNSQVNLISVPRDLWVKLPNGKEAKINTAFTLGEDPNRPIASGGQVSKQMATAVSGLPIDYFIAVDFVDFQRLIGQELNGIEVNIPETLDDPWYPIKGEELNTCGKTPQEVADLSKQYSGFSLEKQFACRYEHLHFEQGLVKMQGHEALAYVRSRHGSAGGDFSRSQRQHALLKAIAKKLWSIKALENAPTFFEQVSPHLATDIDIEIVKHLIPALKNTKDYKIKSVVLSTENVFATSKSAAGAFILIPKKSWNAVHAFIKTQLAPAN